MADATTSGNHQSIHVASRIKEKGAPNVLFSCWYLLHIIKSRAAGESTSQINKATRICSPSPGQQQIKKSPSYTCWIHFSTERNWRKGGSSVTSDRSSSVIDVLPFQLWTYPLVKPLFYRRQENAFKVMLRALVSMVELIRNSRVIQSFISICKYRYSNRLREITHVRRLGSFVRNRVVKKYLNI